MVATLYPQTLVAGAGGSADLGRAYARLDPESLVRLDGPTAVAARVTGRDAVGLVTDRGTVAADVVVDATGHAPVLVRHTTTRPAFQSAFGLVVDGRDAELPEGTALFMDWRDHGIDDGGPPSFLYALSRGGRLLLEETTLASWAPVPTAMLKTRLERRLQRRGTVIDTIVADEHVEFPMGGGLPERGQPVAAFGAALGLVSPISGYSVAQAFVHADVVADAIIAARKRGEVIGDAVLDAVWTREARQRRRLQRFALRAACAFNQRDADRFFATFFALPAPRWRGFLDGTDDVVDVRRTMLALFGAVPAPLRLRLVAGAASADGLAVARDLLAGPPPARLVTRSAT
jgi:lycopene beta-cyclase